MEERQVAVRLGDVHAGGELAQGVSPQVPLAHEDGYVQRCFAYEGEGRVGRIGGRGGFFAGKPG